MQVTPYDQAFFAQQADGSLRSAQVVVPLILDLIPVQSVVDFGCGQGTWLNAFRQQGVSTILGLDGVYVDRASLMIEPSDFQACDLARPIALPRQYDLAISLEVAEHLPTKSSRGFVESLVKAAPVVMFSAAIPGQGGTHHINEQWPEFWAGLFARFGYRRFDLIRPRIIADTSVEWWYRQNLFLFADPGHVEDLARHATRPDDPALQSLEVVSSHILDRYKSVRGLARELSQAVRRSIRNRISRDV